MKTKTSILAALVALAGSATLMAQTNVYSLNVVGYVNVSVGNNLQMICNPLNTTNNTIGALLPAVPDFSNLYKWNGSDFDIATFLFGSWDLPNITLNPGEGAFINTGAAATLTFVGEVMTGSLTNPIPAGLSVRSSMVPQAGAVDTLGLTNLSDFDNVYKWNVANQDYDIYTYLFGSWDPSAPTLAVGESVFVNASAPTTWNRTFNPNN